MAREDTGFSRCYPLTTAALDAFDAPFCEVRINSPASHTAYHVKADCEQFGQQWAHGIRDCRAAFPT